MVKKTGRPRAKIERKPFNTKIDINILELLRDKNEETGIPLNRLVEDAVREKYGSDQEEDEP